MNNVRNFVKNLYFILIQICFSQAQETVLSAIGGCSVEQCRVLRRVRCGSVPLYTTKPAQAQGSRLPAMRHRSLNNFHKKWDNNLYFYNRHINQYLRGTPAAVFLTVRIKRLIWCSAKVLIDMPVVKI